MSRNRKPRKSNKRTPKVEQLESRQLMAADLIGVVAGDHDWYFNSDTNPDVDIDLYYGLGDKTFVAGDWLGAGTGDHPGVVRQSSNGLLHWLLDTNGDPLAEKERAFGLNDMKPVVGDWTGAGRTDLGAVQEGSDGLLHWYLDTNNDPAAERIQSFGLVGMTPLVADWDSDGDDDPGAFHIDGSGQGWIYGSTDGDKWADFIMPFGKQGDIAVTGDFDGDGKNDDYGVVSVGSDGLLHWSIDTTRDGKADRHEVFGLPGHQPIVAAIHHAEVDVQYLTNGKWQPIYDDSRGVHALTVPDAKEGSPSPSVAIRIHNPGTAPLTIGKVYTPRGFKLIGNPTGTVAPGGYRSIELQADTSQIGERSGTFSFVTNDGGEELYNFEVQGKVIAPEIIVRDTSNNRELVDDRDTLSFSTGYRGLSSPVKEIQIINDGNAPLLIRSVRTDTNDFIVINPPSNKTLAVKESLTVRIAMRTGSNGSKQGNLIIDNNDRDENPYNIKLTGRVREPVPEISVFFAGVELHDGRDSINFGEGVVGQSSRQVTLTLRNTGNAKLVVSDIKLPQELQLISAKSLTVAADGGTAHITLVMPNSRPINVNGRITIISNDGDEEMFDISATGSVVAAKPEIEVEYTPTGPSTKPTPIQDGRTAAINIGERVEDAPLPGRNEVQHWFTIGNSGTTPLNLKSIAVPSGFVLVGEVPTAVLPGSSVRIRVELDTSKKGKHTGDVVIRNDDTNESVFNFRVSGEVTAPEIQVSIDGTVVQQAGQINFGGVTQSASHARTLFVSNRGTADLVISGFNQQSSYTVSGLGNRVIRKGQTIRVTVRLDTKSLGEKPGSISFATNDKDERSFKIDLRAKVFAPVVNVGGKPASPRGTHTVIASGGVIELAPAHGNTPFGGRYVLYSNGSRLAIDGTLTKLKISGPGASSTTVKNWTNVQIEIAQSAIPILGPALKAKATSDAIAELPFSFDDDAIVISASDGADPVASRQIRGDRYELTMYSGSATQSQPFTLGANDETSQRPISRVIFRGGDGNDRINNDTDIPTTLNGGGRRKLHGNNGRGRVNAVFASWPDNLPAELDLIDDELIDRIL